jgi:hypothetical protein
VREEGAPAVGEELGEEPAGGEPGLDAAAEGEREQEDG